ncbi:MAG: MarR family transcriptional regulator [Hyphomonadaceae bacterium]
MAFEKTKSAGFLANHMARLFARHLQAAVAPLGLMPAQFMTLLELWEGDGLTQADLVARLDVEQATLANTLKRMERDGLIRRRPHPSDSRAQLIYLTPKARDMEAPAKAAAQSINQVALAGLSKPDREALLRLMNEVVGALRAGEA